MPLFKNRLFQRNRAALILRGLLINTFLLFSLIQANASEIIPINLTNKTALLDGQCGNDEWAVATKIELPEQAELLLMYDQHYFYLCAKGKAEDYAVLDLYIENAKTGAPHKFHLSAQMGERVFNGKEWERVSEKWVLNDYAGFWVPYSGLEDQENRKNPKFARGTHRQLQISRKKFAGNTWNMMIGLSAIKDKNDNNVTLFFPEKATENDKSSWQRFSFSK